MPGSVAEAPVICTGCTGLNSAGEPNDGKPTAPFDVPVADHVGRYLDSTTTPTLQHLGIRTLRAGIVRLNASQNRVYLKLGSAIGAYDLDIFFTGRLADPMVAFGGINTGSTRPSHYPKETAARIDAFIYPEAHGSGWTQTPFVDSSERLEDFDTDDRGYVHYLSNIFGWGIHKDDGRTDGKHLPFVVQVPEPYNSGATLFTMKSGDSYYAYLSDSQRTRLYNVTVPASPVLTRGWTTAGGSFNDTWVREWAKNDTAGHVAVIQNPAVLRVYTYAALIAGGEPLVEHVPVTGRKFTDVSFDEAGNLWVTDQGTGSMLWKLAAGTYEKTAFAIGGATFRPETLHAAGGHVAVAGTDAVPSRKYDLLLLKVVDGTPQPVGTDTWFRRYYHWAPAGFAQPAGFTSTNIRPFLLVQDGLTYLFYNAFGLADVYEVGQELRPPTLNVTSISPVTGPPAGGTVVTILGNVFAEDAVVSFGGTAAPTTFVSANQLTAIAPPHAPGKVTVTVSSNGDVAFGPTFTYALAAPANLTAAGTSASTVSVAWSDVPGATSYHVYRNDEFAGETTGAPFTDSGRTADTSYTYFVRAFDASGNQSPASKRDVATTVQFSDPSITPGMKVKAVQLADLRRAANALRVAAGFPALTWTQSSKVLAIQFGELRGDIANARSALGLTAAVFTEPVVSGATIKAVHMQELINAVR